MLEIDPENHTGQGGILDTVSGNFYPFSSVVSPTHSSIVRFDDTNVVLIKLDPDTHDSSAIIMDEVSGNVYPISPDPADNYQLMYQGNYTTGSSSATSVTLITKLLTLTGEQKITITPDAGYGIFPIYCYGNASNEGYDIKASNTLYMECWQTVSDYHYTRSEKVIELASTNPLLGANHNQSWIDGLAYELTVKSGTPEINLYGVPFMVHKADLSNITPEEAVQHVTIEVS